MARLVRQLRGARGERSPSLTRKPTVIQLDEWPAALLQTVAIDLSVAPQSKAVKEATATATPAQVLDNCSNNSLLCPRLQVRQALYYRHLSHCKSLTKLQLEKAIEHVDQASAAEVEKQLAASEARRQAMLTELCRREVEACKQRYGTAIRDIIRELDRRGQETK